MKQLELLEAPLEGISLVEAGAGTGKTYNIVGLYIRVLLEKKLMPRNILVLTYTEAATSELKTRLRRKLSETIKVLKGGDSEDPFLNELIVKYGSADVDFLEQALYSFDESSVSTIHGFCQKILKEESIRFNLPHDFEILADDFDLFQQQTDRFWREFVSHSESTFEKAVINLIYEKGYTPDRLSGIVREVIAKPFTKIVPTTQNLSFYGERFTSLELSFLALKKAFSEEKERIVQVLEGDEVNKKKYRNAKALVEGFNSWLNRGRTPINPYEKLLLFGSFIHTEGQGLKSGKRIDPLTISPLIDAHLELYKSFEDLEQAWINESVRKISEYLSEEKQKRNVLTYQDLLEHTYHGLTTDSSLSEILLDKYPVALIDEFQDTDPVQYSIFSSIYNSTNTKDSVLFMIGDPKQAIYSFRGADVHTYIKARDEAQKSQRYLLKENYRSSSLLIQSVNDLFTTHSNPFFSERIEFNDAIIPNHSKPDHAILSKNNHPVIPLQFIELDWEGLSAPEIKKNISRAVANEIIELLEGDYNIDGKRLSSEGIAILVRTHEQALFIQDQLSIKGLKSIIKSKENVFYSQESEDLYLFLSALRNPSFEAGLRSALATELLGFKSEELHRLLEENEKWDELYNRFIELSKTWSEKGINNLIQQADSLFELFLNYGRLANAERKLTNLFHLVELLSSVEQRNKYLPDQLLHYFKKQRESSSGYSDEEILRLESDDELIQILTMHSSKGLEFPVVFCPYLWEGVDTQRKPVFSFHDDEKNYIDIGTSEDVQKKNRLSYLKESLAERVRLSYVSLTRAKSACFVITGNGNNSELSPLNALFEGSEVLRKRLEDKVVLSPANYRTKHINEATNLTNIMRQNSSNTYSFRSSYANKEVESIELEEAPSALNVLEFQRKQINNHFRISSFSSLTHGNKEHTISEKTGAEYDKETPDLDSDSEVVNKSPFTLPKGPKIGTLLHEIFEEVIQGEKALNNDLITKHLKKHQIDEEWNQVIFDIINGTLSYPLIDGTSLSDIPERDTLIEMEFHFPHDKLNTGNILTLIRESHSSKELPGSVYGYMKGFIDLIFKYDGRYYILDYKSNYLGNSLEHYSQEALRHEIEDANYDLQYHIYCVALHRMLKNTLSNYDYDKHFGGVFYLFLRGIDQEKPGSGIFFDKPKASIISSLDNYFKTGRYE